ncbi:MAG: 2-succinyl-5-enolpyruvyl-6-hydroxy-3-cyclohexene-1-carboxylic-acid synthase [Prevotella sp.]|nr:2-succinyl-5-enolpyruvyl-6-hydroxy-3-cyclohexene-1-carboxylic-acid synthase [Prevotella sp.]
MYSNKENVNILTALLVKWGVKHAVVCPGSRNAPIVHNLHACPDIECYPVTDERSAAFFALGVSQVEDDAVAVCVTSGSALLNVAPAVAEALYQHRKLIIISADRPAALIDQLQGQTLPQANALGPFVRKAVNLPEPHDDTERWYCNRLINEALIETVRGEGGPVHINVPISEPLFDFSVESLPDERTIYMHQAVTDAEAVMAVAEDFKKAKRPMVLIGQTKPENLVECDDYLLALDEYAVILDEKLGNDMLTEPQYIDEMLLNIEGEEDDYLPDFIVYMGDTFVSKRLKEFLRKAKEARVVVVNLDGAVRDVFMNATDVVQASIPDMLAALAATVYQKKATPFQRKWSMVADQCYDRSFKYEPSYSQMMAVQDLCFGTSELDCEYQFANSMAVRLGLLYSAQYMFVNRGVNGIEGSLSTAVGFACAIDAVVFCVIGDLSFFYDQNALWNNNLTSNLRILLLNNGCGGIFRTLTGLKESAACETLVSASHQTTAEGICLENDVRYIAAHNEEELRDGIKELTTADSLVPILLEVFTDPEEDDRVYRDYFYGNKKQMN